MQAPEPSLMISKLQSLCLKRSHRQPRSRSTNYIISGLFSLVSRFITIAFPYRRRYYLRIKCYESLKEFKGKLWLG